MEFFDIQIDDSNIKKIHKALKNNGQKAIDRAMIRALNSGRSAFTSGSKGGAPKIYNVKKSELDGHIDVSKSKFTLSAKSPSLTIGQSPSHFNLTPKEYRSQKGIPVKRRRIAAATVKKGKKRKYQHGFIMNPARVKGGTIMLWERSGKYSLPEPVRRVSVAQMLSNPEIYENVSKAMNETLSKRLDHEMKRMGL